MAGPIPFDEHAERLKIRSSPRPVTRINRKVLIIGAGLAVLGLFTATSLALRPAQPVAKSRQAELYNVTQTRQPDGLSSLPTSYADLRPVNERIARLGPPLPGDLGSTIVAAERDLGIDPDQISRLDGSFRPSAEDEAARARRMRKAQLEESAAAAPVFFSLNSQTHGASPPQSGAPHTPSASLGSDLLALAAAQGAPQSGLPRSTDPNLQSRKIAFTQSQPDNAIYNPHSLETPASPYQLMAGTLIPASLITGLNSDLPGMVIAQVTQPVYDTATGTHILIPQGSRLMGRYQSEVSFGQDRALVTWERVLFPSGASIQISAPGADAQGYAGLSDSTDHHWDRVFAAAGLATLLGIGAELGQSDEDDLVRAIRRGTGDTVNEAGKRVVDRNLGIQPTLKIRPGWPVRVIVTRDLILKPTK